MIKKILCSLIIGFSLVSFSSAYEIIDQGKVLVDIPSNFSLNSKDYSFDYYGDITTDLSSYFEWKNYNGNFYLDYLYGWIDGKLYFYSYESESNRTSQGFVNSFWKTNNLSSTRNFNYSATDFYNLNPDITKIVFGNDSTSITYSDKYRTFYLCFFNNNDSYYYCAGGAPILWYEQEKYSTFTGSLGFLSIDNAKDGNWGFSPFVKSTAPTIPDYDFNEDDDFTNEQIIEGYNAMGLTDEFCYGGFALDNIFEAGTVPEMFTGYRWGSGAFIFDIWDIYSGAYNNDYISFLRSFYISYENNNYSDFYGKTKAIYGFFNQWFSVSSKGLGFIEATAPTFTLVDIWQYCDIKFNQDPNAIYTGNRWDPKFRYYTSGQVNLGGYFNFSGNNNYFSGNLSGFNTPKDFFASLNSIFQGGLNNLETRNPVLPTYIITFFLAIIFIRIISH